MRRDADGGDSPLGNLIADAQKIDDTIDDNGAPVIALMNPGGIRADLVEDGAGNITYGAAFAVQPFNNLVASMDLTGADIKAVLNQQWNGGNEGTNRKILQVSGLSYTWDASDAAAIDAPAIVGDVMVDDDGDPGTPMVVLQDDQTYRVAMNNFIADGGDNFTVLRDQGREPGHRWPRHRLVARLPPRQHRGRRRADTHGPDLPGALIQSEHDDGAGAVRRPRCRRWVVVRSAQRTASRSTTKTRVSPGLITPPAPRSP